jgi:UDP-N-acetylmuramoyl-tripeptide--D-alanyl-D-alanine ligase
MFGIKRVQKKLEKCVKKYFAAHPEVKLVLVAGTAGRTNAKVAIASVLAEQYRVRMNIGSQDDALGVPCGVLGLPIPDNYKDKKAWKSVLREAKARIKSEQDVDVIVQMLGIEKPGDALRFAQYLLPYITVITAITPEHLDSFGALDPLAKEIIDIANVAQTAIIGRDDVDGDSFARYLTNPSVYTYGSTESAEFSFIIEDFVVTEGYKCIFKTPSGDVRATIHLLGEQSIRPASAALAVGGLMQLPLDKVVSGMSRVRAVPGYMNLLRGVRESLIIDDTYSSNPASAAAAIQTLYSISAPSRIAVIGDMHSLGNISAEEHTKLGKMCDGSLLSWVVTVGRESAAYTAKAAMQNGCQAASFANALQAGAFVNKVIEPGAVVLFKGSRDDLYLEEAIKIVLHSTSEEKNLVRQSTEWMTKKRQFFESIEPDFGADD